MDEGRRMKQEDAIWCVKILFTIKTRVLLNCGVRLAASVSASACGVGVGVVIIKMIQLT